MAKQTSTLPQYQYKRKHGFFYNLKKYRVLTLMCVPAIVFFFAFNYMPLPGIYVAFVKYNYRDGIFGSKFVGMKNFEFLMQSGKLLGLTKNTILYNLAFIFLGNIIAMLMAVLLNEIHNKYFKKVSQTLMFLPYFISQVLVGFLVFNLLNYDTGFINGILVKLGMEKWQASRIPIRVYGHQS
jgi:putative aldouronate transport system permease protein